MVESFVRPESCTAVLLPQLCDVERFAASRYYSSYFQDQFFRIWVDKNKNRDLTDDGPPLISGVNTERPWSVGTTAAILQVPYASGQVLPYAIVGRPGLDFHTDGLVYSPASVWRGEVEAPSGRQVLAIVVDGNANGLFDEYSGGDVAVNERSDGADRDFVCLDLDGNGWLNECDFVDGGDFGEGVRTGAVFPSQTFDWNGGRYTLSVAPSGREVTIVETGNTRNGPPRPGGS